ncbi:MAG: A/G-specific adenine glycosylase [Thermoflexaceae bacterium]|nr:A/G-specific adenine glycosylase [Thermoflexaceae bacterium]
MNDLEKIVTPLLDWYHVNARILPWRKNKDPYRVWVSEIMLQQTRVEAVIPYYERFMQNFPDIQALAQGDEELLLKLWEGLGYYSRAKNLQKSAQIICREYQGKFPVDYQTILTLPGIGEYTAGAISSIAFEKPVPAVDGNVLRVITRITEDGRDIQDAKLKSQITQELREIYPKTQCGDFTQSLMELGAMVCVPNGAPKCEACPLNALCGAYKNHAQMLYPVKKKKGERKIEKKTVLILYHEDAVALNRREGTGLLSGMWEFPNLDGEKSVKEIKEYLGERGILVKKTKKMPEKKHIFSHVEWHMKCFEVWCDSVSEDNGYTWVTAEQLEKEVALPTAFKKILPNKP